MFLNIVSSHIYALSEVLVELMDASFVEICVLDLQKVIHSSDDAIITVKKATTELLLYVEEEVSV